MIIPRFSTAWEREDYERQQRGEPPLGPRLEEGAKMSQAEQAECSVVRLRGAVERLLMILDHRVERNYEIAMKAVESAMSELRTR